MFKQYTSSDPFTPSFHPRYPACPLHPPAILLGRSLVTRHRTSYFHSAKGRSPNSREDSSLRLILRPEQTSLSRALTGSRLLWSSHNNSHVIGEFCQARLLEGSAEAAKHPRDQCPKRDPVLLPFVTAATLKTWNTNCFAVKWIP